MLTQLLPLNLYPNGQIYGIWNSTNIIKEYPNLFILHNNYIVSSTAKLARRKEHHFDYYDYDKQICKYSWWK